MQRTGNDAECSKERKSGQEGHREGQRKTAIVTGASSGIGKAIAERLCQLSYEVYGLGRCFSEESKVFSSGSFSSEFFHAVELELLDTEELLRVLSEIRKERTVSLLVNNAGVAYYGLHEELSPRKIQEIIRTDLELPLLLSQQLLRDLKKSRGRIINIASVTALHASPHGAAYGAAKAGLLSFGRSLFEEARKYGVGVTTLLPDMTETALYRNADFTVGEEEESFLLPEEIADAVEFVLSGRAGRNLSELVLQPQLRRIRRKTKEISERRKK